MSAPSPLHALAASSGAQPPVPPLLEEAPVRPQVSVVMHDVAPARWASCLRVIAEVQAAGREAGVEVPLTLLVVPRFHGELPPASFARWLRRQSRAGHELALHGLTHLDDAPPGSGLRDHARRRWLTDGEGEFSALSGQEAARRLALGRAWALGNGLPVPGFVPPAWLINGVSLQAVEEAGFRYTCTRDEIVLLPGRRWLPGHTLVYSTRSAWRRVASLLWNASRRGGAERAALMRFELHPGDADHAAVLRQWRTQLVQALRTRDAVRLVDVVTAARQASAGSGPAPPGNGPARS